MAKPKEDRLALLQATRTNISPVYSLVDDAGARFGKALRAAPVTDHTAGTDLAGQSHQLEVITDPRKLEELTQCLRGRPLYIADGHHRYETALSYQAEHPDDPAA